MKKLIYCTSTALLLVVFTFGCNRASNRKTNSKLEASATDTSKYHWTNGPTEIYNAKTDTVTVTSGDTIIRKYKKGNQVKSQ